MKIDVLCGSGSTNGVHLSDLHGVNGRVGVGGSEYALLTMCEAWSRRGDTVVLYNNPTKQEGVFEQRQTATFNKTDERDVLIIFREPTPKIYGSRGKKVFWSCDQYTIGDFAHFSQFVDKTVTISPFHTRYFGERYGILATEIDLPVRSWEYEKPVEKIPNRLIFTSVPDRGLGLLSKIFPRIREQVPDATLVITSDYRLWGSLSPNNQQYIQQFMRHSGVEFLGAVPRARLIEEQQKAQIHIYPGIYDELFCVAVAESQVAGTLPITSSTGALETTNMGIVIHGDPRDQGIQEIFVRETVKYLKDKDLKNIQNKVKQLAVNRFSIEEILKEWDEKIFK